ncbi:MAG: hypothetical protein IJP22_03845, partial [Clostridia bacterium]|nr:hypothetical protein [Clostridia bacterium]
KWTALNDEALHSPAPVKIKIEDKPDNFLLQGENCYYLFVFDSGISGDANVTITKESNHNNIFTLNEKVKSVTWLDNGKTADFTQNCDKINIQSPSCSYGENFVVRIAKICI